MQLCLGMRLRGALLYEHEYFMWTYFNSYETLRDLTFVYVLLRVRWKIKNCI